MGGFFCLFVCLLLFFVVVDDIALLHGLFRNRASLCFLQLRGGRGGGGGGVVLFLLFSWRVVGGLVFLFCFVLYVCFGGKGVR